MELGSILGISALLLSLLIGAWLKVLTSRAFKSLDESVAGANKELSKLVANLTNVEKDVIRIAEEKKRVKDNIDQIRSTALREAQIMANQLDAIHNKIQYIDDKLDRMRDFRK